VGVHIDNHMSVRAHNLPYIRSVAGNHISGDFM
jgi:hypothetical protein